MADKSATISKKSDETRKQAVQNIALESQFYSVFRTTIRNVLNRHEHRTLKRALSDILETAGSLYYQRLTQIIEILKQIMRPVVEFVEITPEVLAEFDNITGCSNLTNNITTEQSKYCIRKEGNPNAILTIPKKHLISGLDNERIYYARIADEFIRFRRIRIFMLQPNTYLSLTDTQYRIYANEFLVLQSILNSDYFLNLKPFNINPYVNQIGHQVADPLTSHEYTNEMSLEEQSQIMEMDVHKVNRQEIECITETREIIGNVKSMWKRIFPKLSKEIVYKSANTCSFALVLTILQQRLNTPTLTISNVKTYLWEAYKKLLEMETFRLKIINILKKQGKKLLMESVERDSNAFEHVIHSDAYYITDLDIWVLANAAKLPIILFCSTGIKNLVPDMEWIQLGGNIEDVLYFIRTPASVVIGEAPEYSLIMPIVLKSNLKQEFIEKVDVAYHEKSPAISGLVPFLNSYVVKVPIKRAGLL